MRVVFLTEYYPPERGAPQTRLRETIAGLRDLGFECSVVTGPPHYPGGRVLDGRRLLWPRRDRVDGVTVHRLPMIPRPNGSIVDRLIDQGSFAAVAVAAAPIIRRADAFVVESPPLFLGGSAAMLRAMTGRPYVFHVADPWPDFPIAAGALRGRLPIRMALWLESLAYRRASAITTVTPPLVDRLAAKPGAAGKVRLVTNAVDISRFRPDLDPQEAKAELGWGAGFTLVYSGTVGIAQGLDTLIEAMRLPPETDVTVRVIGDGIEADALRQRATVLGLERLVFQPSIAADQVPTVLAAADGILVLLRGGPLYEESLPTKLLEGLAAGRPLIVSADGYAATVVNDAGAGLVAPAEDPRALADAIAALRTHPGRGAMGAAAHELARTRFSRQASVAALADALRSLRPQSEETDVGRILGAYQRRGETVDPARYALTRPGNALALAERESLLRDALARRGMTSSASLDILEVGCGTGGELGRLVANGADPARLSGIDLRDDAIAEARGRVPEAHLTVGDATHLPYPDGSFDLVYQATALSSMRSRAMRAAVAAEMLRVARPGGVIVSYDFAWNPANSETVGIGSGELRRLFPELPVEIHRVTLVPPLARGLGDRSERALRIAARVAPLRWHRLAIVDVPR